MFCSTHVRHGHELRVVRLHPLDFHALQHQLVVVGALPCTIPSCILSRNVGTFHIDIRTFVLAVFHLVLSSPGHLHLALGVARFRYPHHSPCLAASCLLSFAGVLFSSSLSLLLSVPLLILDPHPAAPPVVQI